MLLAYGLGIVFILIAIWILALASDWLLPYTLLVQGLDWLRANPWESMALAAAFLLLGLLIIFRPKEKTPLSYQTISKFGEVRITQEAIQAIITQAAIKVSGIRKVMPSLRHREDGLEITVVSQLNPEVVLPVISEELQTQIKDDVEHYTGIRVAEVKVLVREFENIRQARVK